MKILILVLFIGFNISVKAQYGDAPFTYVENMPEYKDGSKAMYHFISQNVHYPDSCRTDKGIIYTIVQFTVDTSGFIKNPVVLKGADCGVNEESLRVINLMNEGGPHWNPGMHNHYKVNVLFTLPVKFKPPKQ